MDSENKNRPNWWVITTVFGCASLVACACCYVLGSLGALMFLVSELPLTPRPLVVITPRPNLPKPTATVQFIVPTATSLPDSIFATRTAKFQSIDATNVAGTATAIVYQPTLEAVQTLAAALIEDPTQWTVEEITAGLPPAFGPESGRLAKDQTMGWLFYSSNIKARNFVVQVRIPNPNQRTWTYTLYTTYPCCYFGIDSNRGWGFSADGYQTFQGKSDALDISDGGSNLVQMVVFEKSTVIYVNDTYVGTFEAGRPQIIGEIQLVTGRSSEVFVNVEYSLSDFTVWVFPDP